MTILITGGTGQTGGSLAKLLHAANQPVLIASRSGTAPAPFKAVKFDWFDASTFSAPFDADPTIDKVYLVAPTVFDTVSIVRPFIDLAIQRGVKRFVFCSSTNVKKGTDTSGKIHEYLDSTGVDYVAMRLSWFFENFNRLYLQSIRENNEIFSVGGDGKVGFIAVDDIAQATSDAILAEKTENNEIFVVGPELYTHDEAAALLGEILGRTITHRRISQQEFSSIIQKAGRSAEYSNMLASLQAQIAAGVEEEIFNKEPAKTVKGKITICEFFETNKELDLYASSFPEPVFKNTKKCDLT